MIMSGAIPRSNSASSIPTWTAPRLAPPDSTNARLAGNLDTGRLLSIGYRNAGSTRGLSRGVRVHRPAASQFSPDQGTPRLPLEAA
jgi:hypothetical protein